MDHPAPLPEPRRGARWWLATVLFTVTSNLVLAVGTVVLGLLASVVGWLPPRGRWMYLLARVWSRTWLWASGVRVTSRFEAPLDAGRGYVYMANHQSMFDIAVLIAGIPGEVRFMAKKGLFRIPIFGWSLYAGGFVPVDRGDRQSARETFAVAVKRLESGCSILIFPEETRSRDGRLLPFKRGGVVLALRTGYPIVPVGILGTLEIRPRDSLRTTPGRVRVRYGAPIDVRDYGLERRREVVERVRAEVERLAHGDDGQ